MSEIWLQQSSSTLRKTTIPVTGGIEMAGVKDVLLMRFVPERAQTGLALLRVWTGATLFLRHGLEKQPALGAVHGALS